MTDQKFEQQLQQQIADLPKTKLPERDLWRGIEHALDERKAESAGNDVYGLTNVGTFRNNSNNTSSTGRWLATAASVLLVAMLAWFGGQQYSAYQTQQQSEQFIAALSDSYQQQKDMLLIQFKGKPAFTNNWEDQLKELEDAAKAIHEALQHDPRNPTLLKMLQSIYQQQLQLIERVHLPNLVQI